MDSLQIQHSPDGFTLSSGAEDPEVPGLCFCDLKDECWFQEAEE